MKVLLARLYALPRRAKQLVLLLADLVALPLLLWLAYEIRLDQFSKPQMANMPLWWAGLALIAVGVLYLSGVYRAVVRAFDEHFLQRVVGAIVVMTILLLLVAVSGITFMPRSIPFIFGFLAFLWVWSTRTAIRWLVHHYLNVPSQISRVAIYGAGMAGRQLLAALRASHEYEAVAFFDDDKSLSKATVMGLHVYAGADFERVHERLNISEVLIALPSASRARRKEVISRLEPFRVRVRALPGVTQLVGGEVSLADIQEVDIADLLGRDAVPPEPCLLKKDIADKVVMVTGAGGSIGSELCRQILNARPARLVLFELSEPALYSIDGAA